MPDVLDPPNNPLSPIPPEPTRRRIVCEFCECELGADGTYKKMSDKAKKLREAEEIIEAKEKEIGVLRSEIASLKVQIPAPRVNDAPTAGARSGIAL